MTSRHLAAIQKSTIVRSFGLLEQVAPSAGARWAETLWFTVPRTRGPRGRQARPGRPFQVQVRRPHGRRRGLGRRPDGAAGDPPVVYLVHGWGGWRWQLDPFVDPLVDAGFRVVAFDAPSHGGSGPGPEGPGRSNILEFADALAAVVAANGPAHAVVAHSLGADGDRLRHPPGPAGRPPGVRLPHGRPAPLHPGLRRPARLRRAHPHPPGGQARAPDRDADVGL